MYETASSDIRRAIVTESDAIAAVLLEAFAAYEPMYTPGGFAATTPTGEQLRARFAEGPVWVAERGGAIVGTVSALVQPQHIYIRSMAVRPAARGLGIARQLLEGVERFAAASNGRRLCLSTTPFLTEAIGLYESAGFRRTGETSDLYGTPLLTMAKDLGGPTSYNSPRRRPPSGVNPQ